MLYTCMIFFSFSFHNAVVFLIIILLNTKILSANKNNNVLEGASLLAVSSLAAAAV